MAHGARRGFAARALLPVKRGAVDLTFTLLALLLEWYVITRSRGSRQKAAPASHARSAPVRDQPGGESTAYPAGQRGNPAGHAR